MFYISETVLLSLCLFRSPPTSTAFWTTRKRKCETICSPATSEQSRVRASSCRQQTAPPTRPTHFWRTAPSSSSNGQWVPQSGCRYDMCFCVHICFNYDQVRVNVMLFGCVLYRRVGSTLQFPTRVRFPAPRALHPLSENVPQQIGQE